MAATMVPAASALPDVLPTDRLLPGGKAVPELRRELREIRGARNAVTVVGAWVQAIGPTVLAIAVGHPVLWVLAFVLAGRGFSLLNILGHEAAHLLLFRDRRVNDIVGRWLLAYPAFTPFDLYRRSHFAHHRDEFGPDEPDMNLYVGYPVSRASLRRKLVRDAFGSSGWKNLKPLLQGVRKPGSRPIALRILGIQAVLLAAWTAVGRPEVYVLVWLGSWMTVWRVINRLRAIAEHGGMRRSSDRRETTHVVHQSPLSRFWIAPYNTGWHLAHHVDMGVPWRNLPRFHDELVAAGWVTPAIEHPSYVALWRSLSER